MAAKICGVKDEAALDAAILAGARFIGLVLYPNSPRFLRQEHAAALAAKAKGRIETVALLVDPDDEALRAAAGLEVDWLQMHGRESPARMAQIRAQTHMQVRKGVIKALPIANREDVDAASAYADSADMLVFDAKAAPGAANPGGNGASFDWRLLSGRRFARPWMLSGGLTPENVGQAMRLSGAVMADASSGLENAPGIKDAQRIVDFVQAVHAANVGER